MRRRPPELYDRTFYRLNDVTDLHGAVLAGIRARYTAPFFDALRAYAASPVGQFHALPVARGASIFNSRSCVTWASSTVATSSWPRPRPRRVGWTRCWTRTGALREAMDKAADTWNSDATYFVTNGTSTANKIVVQSLTRPGDIVLIDRNCHKSHHYAGAGRGRTPSTSTLPAAGLLHLRGGTAGDDQAGTAGPGGRRPAGPGPHAAADQLHVRRHRLQPPSR